MPNHIFKDKGSGNFFADCRYKKIRIRGILRDAEGNPTRDRRLAERILAKHKMEVDEGRYLAWKRLFKDLVKEYKKKVMPKKSGPSRERVESIIRNHLIPWFGGMRVSDIDQYEVYRYFQANIKKPESTLKKELRTLKELVQLANKRFKLPDLKFQNKGKRFDETQILEFDDVLEIVRHIFPKYRNICLIASYSGLRLKNVIELEKRNLDLKEGVIKVRQSKTGKPVVIPVCRKLKDIFRQINPYPLNRDDRFFPGVTSVAVTKAAKRAMVKAGFPWASFHHFRHFAACFLINNGVSLEVIQKFMGHDNFRSTQVYARLKLDAVREAVKVFDKGSG